MQGLLSPVFLMSLSVGTSTPLRSLLYSLLISGWPSLPAGSPTDSRGDSCDGFTNYSLSWFSPFLQVASGTMDQPAEDISWVRFPSWFNRKPFLNRDCGSAGS